MSIKGATILIPQKVNALLKSYADDLEQAWANVGEEPLTISFSAKIGVVKGKNIIEVSISFIKEKIKDTLSAEWNPRQGDLFNHIGKMDEDLKRDGMEMTISSSEGRSVTLGGSK